MLKKTIDYMSAQSGRMIREDDTILNIADLLSGSSAQLSSIQETNLNIADLLSGSSAQLSSIQETILNIADLLSGSSAQLSSIQETNSAATVKTYTATSGAIKMTVYCESGFIRIRSDGEPCTVTTGVPLGEGWAQDFNVESISIYFVEESVITVVSE